MAPSSRRFGGSGESGAATLTRMGWPLRPYGVQLGKNGPLFTKDLGDFLTSLILQRLVREAQPHAPLFVDQQNIGVMSMDLQTAKTGRQPGLLVIRIGPRNRTTSSFERTLHQNRGIGQSFRTPGRDRSTLSCPMAVSCSTSFFRRPVLRRE